jgi:amino acid adenylation domain-containing protein
MKRVSLSPIELSFWYQYKFDSASDANNIAHRLVLSRKLDIQTLQDAFKLLVAKHPAFRSNFLEKDGVPYRICYDNLTVDLTDGSKLADNAIRQKIASPFALESDALLRVIFITGENSTTLYVTCPHIIFDAQSWNIFLEDITNALNDKLSIKAYDLVYPAVDSGSQEYWMSKVKNIEGRVSLQQNTTASVNESLLGTSERADTTSSFEKLKALGKAEGLSMNTLCMTIFAIVLSKISDTTQMIIATPVTTRDIDAAKYIGSYINVLPSVIELPRDTPFIQYAKAQSTKIWDDIDNRNFSLINLLSTSSSHYDQQGIYNVMVEYVPPILVNDLVLDDVIIPNMHAKLDLTLSVTATIEGHKVSLEYDATKFEQKYIKQILQVFFSVTDAILQNHKQTIRQLPAAGASEIKELLAIGAGIDKDITAPFIWNRFKASVQTNPSATAIIEKDRKLSYKDLFDMSCKYGDLLAKNGIVKGTVVGIHMERSADYIAGMLAIWSLGAIYVPLDTKQPISRLEYMINQAGIKGVFTMGKSPFSSDVECYNILDHQQGDLNDSSYEPDGDDTAYIIFTSGSTGTPKGVIIEHRSFLNHLEIMIEDLKLSENDVIAQTAPVSFDISVWQLICGLMIGASIVVVDQNDLIDPDNAYEIITQNSVTVLEIVPSLLSGYLTAEDSNPALHGKLESVHVITTGEAISNSIVKQWITHYPNQPLLNAYGPAEASDDTHFFDITSSSADSVHSVPIGRPLLNIQTYIVNQDVQLCPQGVIGEICIGGIAVAKGYVGDKELTAKSFILNPFSSDGGSRLYRTGDYGRWRNDGLLEYHGRRDHQVKVRGQRLELGEVEEKLKELVDIKDAAVVAEKSPSGTRLRGYVVLYMPRDDIADIKQRLRSLLPDYMIPQNLESIDNLPRSANGKLDRKALETLTNDTICSPVVNTQGTESALLRAILEVYSQTLGISVKRDSNYFDCGGDSLQSMKITAMLEKKDIHAGIRDILLYQTPEELAKSIERKRARSTYDKNEAAALKGNTPIQNYYLDVSGPEYRDNGEIQAAIIAIDEDVELNNVILDTALRGIVAAHGELRPSKSDEPIVLSPAQSDAYKVVKDIRAKISLNISMIGCILPTSGEQQILLVAHHFVLDFYSWDVIANELKETLTKKQSAVKSENALKQWWGQALSDLTRDAEHLASAKQRWLPTVIGRTLIVAAHNDDAKQLTYHYRIPKDLIKDVHEKGVSLETLAYYLFVKAYFAATDEDAFVCNIEASIRGIDDTGTLSNGVGWMTYLFPQGFTRQVMDRASLKNFNKRNIEALNHGYEYGLLRYNIAPELFKDEKAAPWTINYLGQAIKSMRNIEVLKALPNKKEAFIEIDVSGSDTSLSFEYIHNTTLPTTYFDAIDKKLREAITEVANDIRKEDKLVLDATRHETILARLKNARRN